MLLSDHASSVELDLLRYQFSEVRGNPYDDNWLVVGGTVTTAEGSWSFADPCLLTAEARRVSAWLRAVAAATVTVAVPDDEGWLAPDTWFIEPVLAFSLAEQSDRGTVVRVHLSMEASPPSHDRADIYQYFVELRLDTAALLSAADQWDRALGFFPDRDTPNSTPASTKD